MKWGKTDMHWLVSVFPWHIGASPVQGRIYNVFIPRNEITFLLFPQLNQWNTEKSGNLSNAINTWQLNWLNSFFKKILFILKFGGGKMFFRINCKHFCILLVLKIKWNLLYYVLFKKKKNTHQSNKNFSSSSSDSGELIHPYNLSIIYPLTYTPATFWWMPDKSWHSDTYGSSICHHHDGYGAPPPFSWRDFLRQCAIDYREGNSTKGHCIHLSTVVCKLEWKIVSRQSVFSC